MRFEVPSSGREEKAAVRRDVAADLEHDLVAVREPQVPRVAAAAGAVHEDGDAAAEGHEPAGAERLAPDSEERAERRRALEADDPARVERPEARAAAGADDPPEVEARPAEPDPARDDHDAAAREELDVNPSSRLERRGPAGEARRGRMRRRDVPRAGTHGRGHGIRGEHEGDREQERDHRRHGTRLAACLLLVALLAGVAGAGPARADGDPASDVLISGKVFLPYDAKIPASPQRQLLAAVKSANANGLPVRVALIWTSYDLGSVPQLFRNPRYYARFLDTEDSYWFKTKTKLVVAMPNGLGFAQWKHSPAAGYRLLAGIKVAPTPAGMAHAATAAVEKLAAAAGVKVSTSGPVASVPTSRNAPNRVKIVAAVAVALLLGLLARVLIRRRAARSALR
jgi:hypothetical protein